MLSEEQMREFEKVVLLRAVDSKWMDHIDVMDQLRQGIHLRAYGQMIRYVNTNMKDLRCLKQWLNRLKKMLRNMS